MYNIYDTLKVDEDDYAAFKPVKLTQYRVYEFHKSEQLASETLDSFVTRLRTLAKDCEFTNIDNEILSQITKKCRSSKVRRRSFQERSIGCDMGMSSLPSLHLRSFCHGHYQSSASREHLRKPEIQTASTNRTLGIETPAVRLQNRLPTWEEQPSRLHIQTPDIRT